MAIKTFEANVKAADPTAAGAVAGQFEAVVSVFNNVDSQGEVVRPGAFAGSLEEWKASGNPIPVFWSHRMDDPMFNIGSVIEAEEMAANDSRLPDWAPQAVKDRGGLWIKALLDQGADASPIATQTHRLLKAGRVSQFSFAYDVLDGGMETVDGQDAYALRQLKLHEASVVQVGANDLTALLGVKEAATAVLASTTASTGPARYDEDKLRKAVELLTEALAPQEDPHNQDTAGKSTAAKAEEPPGAKAEELHPLDIGTVRLLLGFRTAEADHLTVRTP